MENLRSIAVTKMLWGIVRLLIVLTLASVFSSAQQKAEVEFPTAEEINLVVTQSERAFDQYKNSVVMERNLQSSKQDPSSLKKDQELVEMAHKLITALKSNPDGFHGLGGLLLLSTLDDASRNAALCSSSGSAEIVKGLIEHFEVKDAYRIMTIIQTCSDVSAHLYTVSESVHALMVRELEAQQDLNNQAMELANKCADMVKNMPKKP
jgi:hypothetical protein